MGMANVKAKVGTETGGIAPAAGGLSPREGKLGQIKPAYVRISKGLRQEMEYWVGGYRILVLPGAIQFRKDDFTWELVVAGPRVETADFYYAREPEPTLLEVLDYWARLARYIKRMAEDMAEALKEAEAKA